MTPFASLRSRVALAAGVVGIALLGQSDPTQAQPPVTITAPGLPEPGSFVTPTELVADWANYHRSGWQKMDRGWFDSAEREFLGSIRAARRAANPLRTRLLAQSYASLSWALEQQGKVREAEPLARWVLEVWRSEFGESSHITARGINLVATIDLGLGKRADAETLLRPMLAVDSKESASLQQEQARGQSLLGLSLASNQRFAEAEVAYQRAVDRRKALRPRDDAALGDDWNNLAWCQIEQRKLPKAREAMKQALAFLESSRGANDPTVARALDGLARIDADQGDFGAAETKLLRSIQIYEAGGSPLQRQQADALRRYATLLDRLKRPRDAEAARTRMARLAGPQSTSPDLAPSLTPPAAPRTPATNPARR